MRGYILMVVVSLCFFCSTLEARIGWSSYKPSKYMLVFYGKKPKTTESVEEFSKVKDVRLSPGRKKVDLNVPKDGDWSAFYHPFLKFYGNKDLQGGVIFEINHNGVFVKGKQVCKTYLSQSYHGDPKYYKIHYYIKKIKERRDCPYLEEKQYLSVISYSEGHGYALYAEDFDGDVAKVKMKLEGEERAFYTRVDKDHFQHFKYYSPSKDMLNSVFERTPKLKELHGKVLGCLKKKSIECLSKLPHVEPSDKESLQEIFDIYKKYHFPERDVFEFLHKGLSMEPVKIKGHKTLLNVSVSIKGEGGSRSALNLNDLENTSSQVFLLAFLVPVLSNQFEDVDQWPLEFSSFLSFQFYERKVDGESVETFRIKFPKPYKTMRRVPY